MELLPWFKLGVIALMGVSCVQQKVVKSIEKHKIHEGKIYANEVKAQSPFEKVRMDWKTARNLMLKRNVKYREAWGGFVEASEEVSLARNIGGHVGSGLGNTIKNVADPDKLAKSLKSPVTSLPKQFESLGSIKNLSHEMASTAWSRKGKALDCRRKMREEEVKLQVFFKRSELLEEHLKWVSSVKEKEMDPKAKEGLVKFERKLKSERKKWLDDVRDFFNAEYLDVELSGGAPGMADYRGVTEPDFSDWKRWGALNRVNALAKVLKEQHNESKPMIPGTTMVKEKLGGVLNLADQYEAEIATQDVRGSVRKLIRSWRGMKQAQARSAELQAMEKEGDEGLLDAAMVSRRVALYEAQKQAVDHAREVWLLDERCWSEA